MGERAAGADVYWHHREASLTCSCSLLLQNGLPSPSKSYVFNGDFVDRGKQSLEILIILFTFLLIYPKEVHLNRGNHEDHMVNLRYGFCAGLIGMSRVSLRNLTELSFPCCFSYGFAKEVMQKYKVGKHLCLFYHEMQTSKA